MLPKSAPTTPIRGVPRLVAGSRIRAVALHPLSLACGLLLANLMLFGATFSLPYEPPGADPSGTAEVGAAAPDTATPCPQCGERS